MAYITVDDIIEATGGKLLSENSKVFSGVSIDSRTIESGDVFVAIKGEKFNGHEFLGDALLKGGGAIVDETPGTLLPGKVIVSVDDTLRSLQDLSRFLRMKRDIPVVAITGSNGKTTVKEMVHSVLSKRFKTLKNQGNLNNHIGLPLSLLKLNPDDEAVVLEMGMSGPGEIRRLCEIASPGYGVITNIGSAHVGRLGSKEAVRDAKFEILEGLNVAIVNADDGFLMKGMSMMKDYAGQIITFAVRNASHVMARDIRVTETGSNFTLDILDMGNIRVNLNVFGLFNVYNALAAAAVSSSLGMTVDEIKSALEEFRAFPMRFEVIRKGGVTVINDSYNANPASMEESLRELVRLGAGGRVVAVLGDMKELREFSEEAHRNIGRMISDMSVDVFVAVGDKMAMAAEESFKAKSNVSPVQVFMFKDADAAGKNITDLVKQGDTVLIKGSRSMSMEKIIGGLTDVI